MLSFSRDAEREADRVGLETLRDAGFDPTAMVTFFGRLQQATRSYETNAPAYLRTHPMTGERMADLQARIREVRYHQHADSLDFVLARGKLRALAHDGVDGLRTARSTLERQLREGTVNDPRSAWFGVAQAAFAQKDYRGAEQALAEVRRRIPEGHPFVERLAGELRLAQGDVRGSLAIARSGVQRWPQSRALVHLLAQSLIAGQDWTQAVTFLKEQLGVWRADPTLWRLLAQAYDARAEPALAHQAVAEQYALMGGWLAAIEQLKFAQRSGKLDFYAGSQVDVRIQELQAIYRREREERIGR
jgi:predicted Zn-dependent protease